MEERANLINEIKKQIKETIDLRKDFSDEEIRELITNIVFEKTGKYYLSVSEKKEIIDDIFNSMRRLDILQPIIDDKSVTEIMINGPDTIFIEKNGKIYRMNVKFEDRRKIEDVIQTMVSKVNRTVNEASQL